VHQELNVAENLSITENILLGRETTHWGALCKRTMHDTAQRALARLELDLDPRRIASTLSAAQRQMVEIARALVFDAQIIIFDEPTSSLSEQEGTLLLNLILKLKSDGVSVLYVSHRLPEVERVSDRVIALRDGRNSGELNAPQIDRDTIIQLIVGREMRDIYGYTTRPVGDIALQLDNFQASQNHTRCSMCVRRGEIVGIAGLIGSGRTELLESIFGVSPALAGTLSVKGSPISITSPEHACSAGLALVPESRKEQGVIATSSIRENTILSTLKNLSRSIMRAQKKEANLTTSFIEKLKVRCTGPEQCVGDLSGGNQQKIVLARCLATSPSVLLLDEPTRGVDVGARREIYSILFELASHGLAVLFVSSELEEVLGIADRVLVMRDGRITGELSRAELSERSIMMLASHNSSQEAA
jgi:ribose transport system ATP-binding protein